MVEIIKPDVKEQTATKTNDSNSNDDNNNNSLSSNIYSQWKNLQRDVNCSYYGVDKTFREITDGKVKEFVKDHGIDLSKPVTERKDSEVATVIVPTPPAATKPETTVKKSEPETKREAPTKKESRSGIRIS